MSASTPLDGRAKNLHHTLAGSWISDSGVGWDDALDLASGFIASAVIWIDGKHRVTVVSASLHFQVQNIGDHKWK